MPRIYVNPSENGRNRGYWRKPPNDRRSAVSRGAVEKQFEREYGAKRGRRIYYATVTKRAEERARQRRDTAERRMPYSTPDRRVRT